MGKVKPTRIVTPRIVQPDERGPKPWLWLLLLFVLALWSWQVYEFGRQGGAFQIAAPANTVEYGLRERIAELEEEREVLLAAAERFERMGEVERTAAEAVKSQVKALQTERAELKREVAFLKSLVAGGGRRLVLNDQSLSALGEGIYRFEVTLAKRTDDQETVSGQVVISVRGRSENGPTVLDMGSLTEGRRSTIGIRFKSFQRLKTDIRLPTGFEPESIQVAVKPDGKDFESFERAFDWKPSDA